MLNSEQLKLSINQIPTAQLREAIAELRLDGLVTEGKTPFSREQFTTCFADIEARFQRAGYRRQLSVVGYQGRYAVYDPQRWEAVEVQRWLKEFTEEAAGFAFLKVAGA